MKKFFNKRYNFSTLTVSLLAVAVTAAVLVSVVSFIVIYNGSLIYEAETDSERSVTQTAVMLGNYIENLKVQIEQICNEIEDSGDIETANSRLSAACRLRSDTEAVVVYDTDGKILAFGSGGGELKNDLSVNLSYDKALLEKSGDYAISLPHVQTLFNNKYPWVVTIVHGRYFEIFGKDVYISVDFSFSGIAEYVDNVGIGKHGYSYIIDKSGSIVYHPQQQMIFSGLKTEDIAKISKMPDGSHFDGKIMNTLKTLDGSSWRIVGVADTDDMQSLKTQTVTAVILLSVICCIAISLLCIRLFNNIITRPVAKLVDAMQSFEKNADSFRYAKTDDRVAELQILSDSFGHMVLIIQELMEKVRNEEITLRKTELKALQAQINPHFLYNTLDSIQWMCEQGKNADAVNMVTALAKLFRISISRGKELITLKDEMRHVENYLIIQSYRYKNQFSYEFQVDEELTDCLCNKITVQPLVENAIYHGIERMVDEGKIIIRVLKSDDGDILIEVEDNGVGMTEEQCESILKKDRSDSGGIGIKNVNDRLKIYFGEKYGISIKSELDIGTKITVRIPKIRKEQGNEI